jgi:hypothetical protein
MLSLLATGCATGRPARTNPLLADAIDRAGGHDALARVRTLAWDGHAVVHVGGREIPIGVSTRVAPFDWARSTSWLEPEGASKARTMIVARDAAWIESDGRRQPMEAAMAVHERQQYAIYGLMLLEPLDRPGVSVEPLPDGRRGLRVRHPLAPAAELLFDADARLSEMRNTVADPHGGAPVAQRFVFSGEVVSNGVRWPRTLRIEQAGRPYFDLGFDRFEASPTPLPTPA